MITKLDALMVLEVGLPGFVNLYCLFALLFRAVQIVRAGLRYNNKIPDRITLKKALLYGWALMMVTQMVFVFIRNKNEQFVWLQYGKMLPRLDGEEPLENFHRFLFEGSYLLQLIVIFLQIYVLKIEGQSKVNSQSYYTVWYYHLNCILSLAAVLIYSLALQPELKNNVFTMTVGVIRGVISFLMAILSAVCFQNFDLNFNEESSSLTASFISKSKGGLSNLDMVHKENSPRSRRVSNVNLIANGSLGETYTIVVSERVNSSRDSSGQEHESFSINARSDSSGQNFPRVLKTYKDFQHLEITLNNHLRSNEIECPSLEPPYNPNPSLPEKITYIKKFCKALASDPVLHIEAFYDFFQIPPPVEEESMHRLSEVEVSERGSEKALRNGGRGDTLTPSRDDAGYLAKEWGTGEHGHISDYCTFFNVSLSGPPLKKEEPNNPSKVHNYHVFTIKSILDPESGSFQIEKRYSEFYELASKLKALTTTRLPPLPAKLFVKDDRQLHKRGVALLEWLTVVLNENLYYCRELFEFIGLDHSEVVRYNSLDMIKRLKESVSFQVSIVGKQSIQNGEDPFIQWEFRLEMLDRNTKDQIDYYKINKRYKEFDTLHENLKQKFQKYGKSLPDLPGKMSYFLAGQNAVEERQDKLVGYLQKLLVHPSVLQTIDFRKFIKLSTTKIDALVNLRQSRFL